MARLNLAHRFSFAGQAFRNLRAGSHSRPGLLLLWLVVTTILSGPPIATAGQDPPTGCTPLPFLLTLETNPFQGPTGRQVSEIPPELQNPKATLTITSDTREMTRNTVHLHGNVQVSYQDFRLTADDATYDHTTGEVVARGHVTLTDPKAHLEADEGHYNVESETGWFSNSRGYFYSAVRSRARMPVTENPAYFQPRTVSRLESQTPVYVQARRVGREDTDTYSIQDGRVSSCEHPNKGWSFSVRSARLEVEDKVVTHGALFRLLDVPVFYLPVMENSISPRHRKTGFLLPHAGNSSLKGLTIGDGFFWAINSSADLLVGLEEYSKRGLARSAEFRATPGDTSQISVDYFGINDKLTAIPGQTRAPGNSVRAVGQSSDLAYGFRGVLDVDYISSLAFRQTWSDNFTEAVTSEAHQTGFLTKNFDAYSLNFYVSRYQNFLCATGGAEITGITSSVSCPPTTGSGGATGNSITISQMPSASVSGMDKQLGQSPFYFAFEVSAGAVGRTQPGLELPDFSSRFDFHPEVTLRTRPVGGFRLTPSFGVDTTYYGTSLRPGRSPITRVLGDFSVDLRPPSFEKVFERSLWGHRVKHVVQPDIRYRLVRSGDKENVDDIVRYDEIDILTETNELEYSLTNTLMMRKDAPDADGQTPQAREVLSLRLSQKYYFDPTFGGALVPGQNVVWEPTLSLTGFAFAQGRRLSPVVSVLKIAPASNYDTEVRADLNPNGGGVLNAGITSHVRRGPLGLAFTHFFINRTAALLTPPPPGTSLSRLPSFQLLRTVATYGDVDRKGFSGAFGIDYNFAQGIAQQIVSQSSYNFGCFAIEAEYRRLALGTLRQENSYRVALTLSNIGTFGNLKPRERLY